MHIAGALGIPTVALFGTRVEQWFAPLGERHSLLPKDTSQPADVLAAVDKLLGLPTRS
jgi:ADP-heptose:LPS heptosyltransferase